MEVKGLTDELDTIIQTRQVSDYTQEYGLVLVTNYRDFQLMQRGQNGVHIRLERYTLANSADEFRREAAHPRTMAAQHGERLAEYLRRVMLQNAPLEDPKDVAWFLASYARDAKARVEAAEDLPALSAVREALEQGLGVTFEGEKGDHFFRSTLVQTLFYGLFSAWVLWSKQAGGSHEPFDWRLAQWSLHVPMIRALFGQLSQPDRLGSLGLEEVMGWAGEALNRVSRDRFFERFEEEHAVQYFYEPFLAAFDPELRKDLGVWYTPPEIVKYMVARVDTVLREELDIADGLADPNVYVLDPCCGTGAYLVEVLRSIHETLRRNLDDDLVPDYVKRAAIDRVFGFEILPAPFVVAHLQLGLLLRNLGAPLSDEHGERAGVYLTNALTGWEPPREPQARLAFPELEQEREAAEEVKRDKPILVILGNPPYNGFAGVSPTEEQGLVEPYKQGLREWGITKNYLDDLYVRFFRLAERRIAEITGRGVVCYISNNSWVDQQTYVVLRQHFLQSFDKIWIDNMHGDRRRSERSLDGRSSQTIFAIPGFSAGIQQGTVISLCLRRRPHADHPAVLYRNDIAAAQAVERRAQLLSSLDEVPFGNGYAPALPSASNYYSFLPSEVDDEYGAWAAVVEIAANAPSLGLNDNRAQGTHALCEREISQRMRSYYDHAVSNDEIRQIGPGLMRDAARFDAAATRTRLLAESSYETSNIQGFWFRPYDLRHAYIERRAKLWNEVRPELLGHAWDGNAFILARRHSPKCRDGSAFLFSYHLADQHVMHTDAYFFPIRLRHATRADVANDHPSLFDGEQSAAPAVTANLSQPARDYLAYLGIADPDADAETADLVWMHALAIGYSRAYLSENADGIRQDWPRIPLPHSRNRLLASAELGRRIAALLDTEREVPGVTSGDIPLQLQSIATLIAVPGHLLDAQRDLELTADWGHAGKGGVTMPGKGKLLDRAYSPDEADSIGTATSQLGAKTFDIYLNDRALWSNVPERVWSYHIGGYQVIKKWLSYREQDLLGRALTPDEAREVTRIARRIAAILILEPELDDNYRAAKAATYSWPTRPGGENGRGDCAK